MENKFKLRTEKESKSSGSSMFSGIEKKMRLESFFEDGFPVQYVPKIMFVMLLGLIYIGNTHYAEKTVRKINQIQAEVEDLRADYTTLKSDLMFASKQSEVARKVREFGLRESISPPYKVIASKDEH